MRKIYSLVLLAAALLVGTNVWADNVAKIGTQEYASIESAWEAVQDGQTIQLIKDANASKTMWLGTPNLSDPSKSIEIDLNGYNLTSNKSIAFLLTHGKLKISNSRPTVTDGGKIMGGTSCNHVFFLTGSTNKDVDPSVDGCNYFTHLEIAEGVTITSDKYAYIISIDAIYNGGDAYPANSSYSPQKQKLTYFTNVYADNGTTYTNGKNPNKGVANGVRIDVYGTINGRRYGVKINGYVGSPSSYLNSTWKREDNKVAWINDGTNTESGITNYLPAGYTIEKSDTKYSPFIHVYPTAKITVDATVPSGSESKVPMAIYAGGYGRWLIEGTAEGNVGLMAKSGEIVINDATITSTNTTQDYVAPTGQTSSSNAVGSAIVIESNTSYAGDIDVEISGDTKVSATNGYAIDEAVTSANDTKVDAITITGGTFDGGTVPNPDYDPEDPESPQTVQGTINISEKTADANADEDKNTEVTIAGGNMEGTVTLGDGTHALDEVVKPTEGEQNVHVTYVDNGNGGTTMVISAGEAPDDVTNWATVNNGDDVNWKGFSVVTIADGTTLTLGELQLNSADGTTGKEEQKLIIEDNAVLTVDRLIMNSYARLVVEAGGKLIIEGTQGVNAPSVENITLQATASKQAMLLFNPAVSTNRQPSATVQLYTFCYQPTSSTYKWQRFATPMSSTLNPAPSVGTVSNDYNESANGPLMSGSTFGSWVNYWDELTQTWKGIYSWAEVTAFNDFMICNNSSLGGVTYTFKGTLKGSVSSDLNFSANGWNYFGNSYTAPISVRSMIQQVATSTTAVDGTVYVWDLNSQTYQAVNETMFSLAEVVPSFKVNHPDVPAMSVFVMKLQTGDNAIANLGYGPSVYNYNNPAPASDPAPARVNQQNLGAIRLSITDENGIKDEVVLVESDVFTADYDNGADAEKMMADNRINFYAGVEMPYAINASNNMEGMLLSIETSEAINYTLNVENVAGVDYAIKDNLTGAMTLLQEGNTYQFNAQPNATLAGRFQIVSRQEMPTAVETIEENVAPKAIYTVMGQYVGETTDWNTLPAGVYVVDGVKVIK